MSPRPRTRVVRGIRVYDPEPQFFTLEQWVITRHRPAQHLYELLCDGTLAGVLLRFDDGWRWQTTWSPRTGSPRRHTSSRTFPSWQRAAAALANSAVGRRVRGARPAPKVADWRPLHRRAWEPTPAPTPPDLLNH